MTRQEKLRRLEPVQVVLTAVPVGGTVLAAFMDLGPYGVGVFLALLGWAACIFAVCYLWTFAAVLTVTPEAVVVDNPYVRHTVPRHLLRDVVGGQFTGARLIAADAPPIRLVALRGFLPWGYSDSSAHRKARLVHRLLAEVPADPTAQGEVHRRLRAGNLALLVLALTGLVAASFYLLATVR
ncbi:hypothetical protein Cs7R123_20110 [Catellatospora sp. TT07R-123]|uniref:hypothetical protein n=1 Tax=Catellatospora sp. TT07R-123 TaxID=2733863 RepID=UPI001B08A513|nr:hypothetical protein [Catellatospora sp. TT07R-123]GHJ44669.1 hypothetical protein Cs7R123_20110 [Catellatospora sp. TT07R-123]